MSKTIVVTALLAAATSPAQAQSTDMLRLAPGEIPLRIVADGKARTRADFITVTVPVTATAASAVAARESARQSVARITTTLTAQGIPAGAITSGQPAGPFGFIGNEDDDDGPAAAAALAAARTQTTRQAGVVVQVRLTDPTMLARVTQALDSINQPIAGKPQSSLKDDTAARSAAVADAAAHARAEADAYATATGLRVVRVLAISNAPATTDAALGWTLFAAMQGGSLLNNEVVTRRRIQVDYALAPR